MTKIFKCPECGDEIDCLRYSAPATAYGTYLLHSQDWETDETSEDDGDYLYECPECNCEIDLDDLIEADDEDEDEDDEEKEEELIKIKQPEEHNKMLIKEPQYRSRLDSSRFKNCPNCDTTYEFDTEKGEKEIECSRCGCLVKNN